MPKFSRDKGNRFEREVVNTAKQHGWKALRIPLSGAAEGFKGDCLLERPDGEKYTLECKSRANGFKFIYDSLEGNDALVIKADRKRPLVVVDLEDWLQWVM